MLNALEQQQAAIDALLHDANVSRQRRLLILSGEQQWGKSLIEQYCRRQTFNKVLWIADYDVGLGTVTPHLQARRHLGTEIDLLIYDAYCGFDPNAVAAVTGALCAGGLLVFIIPPLEQWHKRIDPDYRRLLVHPFEAQQLSRRFIQWIKQSLLSAPSRLLLQQHPLAQQLSAQQLPQQPLSELHRLDQSAASNLNAATVNEITPADSHRSCYGSSAYCRTQDQWRALQGVVNVATGHRRRPLVITSDRGRGKSSALGIASAQLMHDADRSIVVTAPNRDAVRAVFEHAAMVLNIDHIAHNALLFQDSTLRFVATDELLKQHVHADLLLVDEAAAIPVAMLEKMLKRYSRIVFATTEHGYEGTGRGFAIRFRQSLDAITPQWRSLSLHQPIRWAAHDPVERWLFDALLLDCRRAPQQPMPVLNIDQCVIERVDRDALLQDRQSLQQLFGLLVNAHYQTSPNDLRNLLDGPNLSVWLTRFQGYVVAAVLVAAEGGFEPELADAVWQGQRRPQGHLLPQTLAVHCGWREAPGMRYWRVMRIAVDPNYQRRGLGRQLLQSVIRQARTADVDMLGSSFAATADVMAFWRQLQCVPVRVGITRDACTGVPSSLVLSALSVSAQHWLADVRARFVDQFCYALGSLHRDLAPDLVVQLLVDEPPFVPPGRVMDQQDWLDVRAFADGQRQLEVCLLPLHKLVCTALADRAVSAQLSDKQQTLLVCVVLEHHRIKQVADELGMTGKKQLISQLREVIGLLLDKMFC